MVIPDEFDRSNIIQFSPVLAVCTFCPLRPPIPFAPRPFPHPPHMNHDEEIDELVRSIDRKLRERNDKLVLVESCTCGLVASYFGRLPGISDVFCGSLVVYRNDSKHQWLGIDQALLDDPNIGPVSPEVTLQLAQRALEKTPEATIAAAITGHLGPNAPEHLDGVVYVAVAFRLSTKHEIASRIELESEQSNDTSSNIQTSVCALRHMRQIESTCRFVRKIQDVL